MKISPTFLLDSNVILDMLEVGSSWHDWSFAAYNDAHAQGRIVINLTVFAEVSVNYDSTESTLAALPPEILIEDMPIGAAFLAGKAYRAYKRAGGIKASLLPDFFIGAHALIGGFTLVTRDSARFRTYFPGLAIISPKHRPNDRR